jgi:hypothetical protein
VELLDASEGTEELDLDPVTFDCHGTASAPPCDSAVGTSELDWSRCAGKPLGRISGAAPAPPVTVAVVVVAAAADGCWPDRRGVKLLATDCPEASAEDAGAVAESEGEDGWGTALTSSLFREFERLLASFSCRAFSCASQIVRDARKRWFRIE